MISYTQVFIYIGYLIIILSIIGIIGMLFSCRNIRKIDI